MIHSTPMVIKELIELGKPVWVKRKGTTNFNKNYFHSPVCSETEGIETFRTGLGITMICV